MANGAAAEDHDAAATAATLMQEVRALIEPIRTLRGALFALRMALVDAVAEPGTRLAMVPFHDLEPVLHGWIAERLDTARGLSGDSLNDVAAEVGRELAGTRSAGEVAGAFRELARERKLEPQSALSLDERSVGRLRVDIANLNRLKAAVQALPRVAERLTMHAEAIPRHMARIESLVRDIGRKAERAADGNKTATVGLALDALTLTTGLMPLIDDLKTAPARVAAVGHEVTSLADALESARISAPDLLGDVGLPRGLGDLPRLDTAALAQVLADALESGLAKRAGVGQRSCTLLALSALEATVSAHKPRGTPWDAFDGPDLRLDCPGQVSVLGGANSTRGHWLFSPPRAVPTTMACVLRDQDVQFDDDIGPLVFTPPPRAGEHLVRAGGGLNATATWVCLDP